MTISDAQPGDIYLDPSGMLWRIVAAGPAISAQEVDGVAGRRALINDPIWHGWQRVFRRAA